MFEYKMDINSSMKFTYIFCSFLLLLGFYLQTMKIVFPWDVLVGGNTFLFLFVLDDILPLEVALVDFHRCWRSKKSFPNRVCVIRQSFLEVPVGYFLLKTKINLNENSTALII